MDETMVEGVPNAARQMHSNDATGFQPSCQEPARYGCQHRSRLQHCHEAQLKFPCVQCLVKARLHQSGSGISHILSVLTIHW